jgi:hypothetical protein
MPTEIVELSIASTCIVAVALTRSSVLAPRDGLNAGALAAATTAAATPLLIGANLIAFLLGNALPASIAPMIAIICSAVFSILMLAILKKSANVALRQLLIPLTPAILCSVLLLSGITTLLAPSEHLLHAALTAVGAGFGFTLLLQLCAALDSTLTLLMHRHASTLSVLRLPQYQPAIALLVAALLAMAGITITARW